MKKSILTSSLLALLAFLLIYGCCKREDEICMDPTNPKCANYDPCHGVEPPSGMFEIQENIRIKWPGSTRFEWMPDDSVFWGRDMIRFSSPYTSSEYKHTWYLGIEKSHDAVVQRDFSSVPLAQRPTTITVSHVLEYPIDSACYPNATGRDSVTRTFYLVRNYEELGTYGHYRGVFENQTDSFDFSIVVKSPNGSPVDIYDWDSKTGLVNFHNEGDTVWGAGPIIRNQWSSLIGEGSATPMGLLTIDPTTKQFEFEYRYKLTDFKVIGRKLD